MADILLTAAFLAALVAPGATAAPTPVDACPEPVQARPVYPPDLIRRGKRGTSVVAYRTDECGRVLEALVDRSSGHALLDREALAAVRASVLSAQERAAAVDGWHSRELVFNFNEITDAPLQKIAFKRVDWPKSHRRPEYRLAGPIEGEAEAEALGTGLRDMEAGVIRQPVMNVPHSFLQVEGREGLEFWLLLRNETGRHVVAAHYRPLFDEGQPVVWISTRCELSPEQCQRLEQTFLGGLPFARARKPRD